jgi:hypothetical protein
MPFNIGGFTFNSGMAFNQIMNRITNNGLVQYIDASNPSSYGGTGSTWFDLTSNGHNISLGSTVSYTTDFGGVLRFPQNADGYGRNSSMNLSSSNYTVISYVRKMSNENAGRTITAQNNNWLLAHHDNTYGDYYAEGWVNNIASPTSDTIWRMYTGTGNISGDVYQLYINDGLIISNSEGSQGPNGWNLNSQYGQSSDCQIANLIVYNRVLTSTEITQIYHTTKSRFGL